MRNLFIFASTIALVFAAQGNIDSVKRRCMLLEPDVTVFKSEVVYELPDNAHKSKKVSFTHIVPIDYADDITDVLVKDIVNR